MTYRISLLSPDVAPTLRGLRRELDRTVATLFPAPMTAAAGAGVAGAGVASAGAAGAGATTATPTDWQPATDVVEDAASWTLTLDVPGVPAEALDVVVEARVLTVRGSRPAVVVRDGAELGARERRTGRFVRRFRLPPSADAEQLSAQLADGVLTLRIGKVTPPQPRRVRIETPVATVAGSATAAADAAPTVTAPIVTGPTVTAPTDAPPAKGSAA